MGAVVHLEQGVPALAAELQVVRSVDDLYAQVQRLEEELSCRAGPSHLIGQDARRRAKRPQLSPRRPHALCVAGVDVAEARVDQVTVDRWEKAV